MLDQRFRQRLDGVVVDVRKIRRGERPPALMMPDPDFLVVYEQPHVARLGPDRNLSPSSDQVLLLHGSPPVIRILHCDSGRFNVYSAAALGSEPGPIAEERGDATHVGPGRTHATKRG